VEELAARTLLSASVIQNPLGQLVIQGGTGNNSVQVTTTSALGADEVMVTINGTSQVFAASGVKSIELQGGSGNLSFTNHTAIPALAMGGTGNNTLVGGTGNDTMIGGLGNDQLSGASPNDLLLGGAHRLTADSSGGGTNGGANNSADLSGDSNPLVEFQVPMTGSGSASGILEMEVNQDANGRPQPQLEVEVQGATPTTTYGVFMDSTQVGQVTTDASGNGVFVFTGIDNLPPLMPTTVISVQQADGTIILQGTFQPLEQPPPPATGSNAVFSGQLIGSAGPQGVVVIVETQVLGTTHETVQLNFQGGQPHTTYDVVVDGTTVGQVTTGDYGEGQLQLSDPANFPAVAAGSVVSVQLNGAVFLQATLQSGAPGSPG
jgi:hypothetical protein